MNSKALNRLSLILISSTAFFTGLSFAQSVPATDRASQERSRFEVTGASPATRQPDSTSSDRATNSRSTTDTPVTNIVKAKTTLVDPSAVEPDEDDPEEEPANGQSTGSSTTSPRPQPGGADRAENHQTQTDRNTAEETTRDEQPAGANSREPSENRETGRSTTPTTESATNSTRIIQTHSPSSTETPDPAGAINAVSESVATGSSESKQTEAANSSTKVNEASQTTDMESQKASSPKIAPREVQLLSAPAALPRQSVSLVSEPDVNINEIILLADTLAMAKQQQSDAKSLGLRIKRRQILKALGLVVSVYRLTDTADGHAAISALNNKWSEYFPEFNRYYYLQGNTSLNSGGRQYAKTMVGLGAKAQGEAVTIAMLDGMVDHGHPAFLSSRITTFDVTAHSTQPSRHGTAVASLLVGDGVVHGALPRAHLIAVNIFSPSSTGKLRTQTDWWLSGLNKVLEQPVKPAVINMSFGGGSSPLLAAVLNRVTQQGIKLVAAAGNGGPRSAVTFPANLPTVIAVSAINLKKKISSQSPYSIAVDMVAPGVDVWSAGLGGKGFYATGSSFAAPWVSASIALAQSRQQPDRVLYEAAEDLGKEGKDVVYGYGLVRSQ